MRSAAAARLRRAPLPGLALFKKRGPVCPARARRHAPARGRVCVCVWLRARARNVVAATHGGTVVGQLPLAPPTPRSLFPGAGRTFFSPVYRPGPSVRQSAVPMQMPATAAACYAGRAPPGRPAGFYPPGRFDKLILTACTSRRRDRRDSSKRRVRSRRCLTS